MNLPSEITATFSDLPRRLWDFQIRKQVVVYHTLIAHPLTSCNRLLDIEEWQQLVWSEQLKVKH
jgi:hypothetical protein